MLVLVNLENAHIILMQRADLWLAHSGASTPCGTMQTKSQIRISLYYLNVEKHTEEGIL